MPDLCRWQAYGYVTPIHSSLFFRGDPKKACSGSPSAPPASSGLATQDVAVLSTDDDAICCVSPLPRDRPLATGKGRCGYSLTVVHFRKLRKMRKVGS